MAKYQAENSSNRNCCHHFSALHTEMEEYYSDLEHTLHGYVYPVIYVIGIPGNLISFALWIHPRLRNSSACYFASIAIFDTLVLGLHLLVTIQVLSATEILNSTILCEVFNVFYLASEIMAVLLILALTVDRYIIVHFPMKRHTLCTTARSIKVILCLTVFAIALGITEGSFWTYDKATHQCITRSSMSLRSGSHVVQVGNVIILVVGILLPAILVLIFNLVIVHKLRKVLAERTQMMEGRAHRHHDHDSTIMLLALSCYMILSEIPDSIVYLLQPFFTPPWIPEANGFEQDNQTSVASYQKAKKRYDDYVLTAAIFGTFSLTNYAINILIYSLAGHKFRHTLKRLCRKSLGSKSQHSHSDDFSYYTQGNQNGHQSRSHLYQSIPLQNSKRDQM